MHFLYSRKLNTVKQLYTIKMDNIEEEDKVLERYYLLRLNHEEIENKNTPVTNTKIESEI